MREGPDGILVVDKPAGMTSHDVVDRVRAALGTRKVGHAGTLDPDATGILVMGVGLATRFLSYAQAGSKRYLATARFGVVTSTQDASGDVIEERDVVLERTDIEGILDRFRGEIDQIPPMVSAVKVGGQRLHRLARKGKEVERDARRVKIHSLGLLDYEPGPPPMASFDVTCSSGTYVRTLVHDIGEALGCGAHLASLRRVASGGFTETDAVRLDAVSVESLRPLTDAVKDIFSFEVDEPAVKLVANGRPINLFGAALPGVDDGDDVAIVHGGRLLGVYKKKGERLLAERVVAS